MREVLERTIVFRVLSVLILFLVVVGCGRGSNTLSAEPGSAFNEDQLVQYVLTIDRQFVESILEEGVKKIEEDMSSESMTVEVVTRKVHQLKTSFDNSKTVLTITSAMDSRIKTTMKNGQNLEPVVLYEDVRVNIEVSYLVDWKADSIVSSVTRNNVATYRTL